jgi:hypothetical protein
LLYFVTKKVVRCLCAFRAALYDDKGKQYQTEDIPLEAVCSNLGHDVPKKAVRTLRLTK